MRAAGIDIGSLTTKAVIMDDGKILSCVIDQTGDEAEQAARRALKEALNRAGIRTQDELYIISTGIGSRGLQFGQGQKAVATCLARGAFYLFPSVRVVIDLGAETSTVVKVNERGRLIDWANQDKCASGTGLFLQQVSKLMQMSVSEMGKLSIPEKAAEITSTCAVFAESEIISHIHRVPPTPKEEIVAGVYQSVVGRLMSLIKRVGIAKDAVVTGGVALSEGFVRVLGKELGFNVLVPSEPQIVGAVGAALIAGEAAKKGVSQ